MTKFGARTDIGYKRVVGELKRWVKSIRRSLMPEVALEEAQKERLRQEG
jgi:hypothetical protein